MTDTHPGGAVLNREHLHGLIDKSARPLISDWVSLEDQLQPNGFDVTLREISTYQGQGVLGAASGDRELPSLAPVPFDDEGWAMLASGAYHILYNEVVDIPLDLMALGRPRSSLGRCGATIHTAVWDAGYRGRSTSLLVVHNPNGFRVQRNARVMQLVFLRMADAAVEGYRGRYLNENIE